MSALEAVLTPHPATPPRAGHRVRATVERSREGELALHYALRGPLAEVRIPAPVAAPRQQHLLWQHTCFEAFLALARGGPYHELNFSPSGAWAAYAFRAYREGAPLASDAVEPEIAARTTEGGMVLTARLALGRLEEAYVEAPLHLALCAVIEDTQGDLSYFALHHPGQQADFHHAAGFTLRLDPPR